MSQEAGAKTANTPAMLNLQVSRHARNNEIAGLESKPLGTIRFSEEQTKPWENNEARFILPHVGAPARI
jgi:hypothetical protein